MVSGGVQQTSLGLRMADNVEPVQLEQRVAPCAARAEPLGDRRVNYHPAPNTPQQLLQIVVILGFSGTGWHVDEVTGDWGLGTRDQAQDARRPTDGCAADTRRYSFSYRGMLQIWSWKAGRYDQRLSNYTFTNALPVRYNTNTSFGTNGSLSTTLPCRRFAVWVFFFFFFF